MDLQPDRLNLRPLAAAAEPLDRIRLLQTAQGLRLMASQTKPTPGMGARTELMALPLTPEEGRFTTVATVDQLLPPPPQWDLTVDTALQRPAWLMDQAQGATSSVRLTGFDRKETVVPHAAGLASHGRPSFVHRRSDEATRQVVAMVDSSQAALFERQDDGRYARRAALCECTDAQLVPLGAGYVLVFKRRVPGPVRGNDLWPGSLHLQPLDDQFRPVGAPRDLMPGSAVFEFAADAVAGRLALLLTSSEGTMLVQAPSTDGPWLAIGIVEDERGAALRSPTLTVSADATAIALLDHTAGRRRILFGGTRRVPPP